MFLRVVYWHLYYLLSFSTKMSQNYLRLFQASRVAEEADKISDDGGGKIAYGPNLVDINGVKAGCSGSCRYQKKKIYIYIYIYRQGGIKVSNSKLWSLNLTDMNIQSISVIVLTSCC